MDADERAEWTERILRGIAKQVLAINSDLLELRASLTVLKLRVAKLAGDDLEAALDDFRQAEQKVVESLPASQKFQELRDLIDVLEKHGKTSGRTKLRSLPCHVHPFQRSQSTGLALSGMERLAAGSKLVAPEGVSVEVIAGNP